MVVHYAGLSRFLRSGPVEEVTMSRFSMGRAVRIIENSESKYSPQEIVRRARSRLGENDYQVLRNNCEHFCNWCISGRSHSTQVESTLASTLRALVIAIDCVKRLAVMLGKLSTTAGRVVPTAPEPPRSRSRSRSSELAICSRSRHTAWSSALISCCLKRHSNRDANDATVCI
jgi:hypothetical protein